MTAGGNKVLVEEIGLTELFADEDAEVRASVTAWLRAHTPWELVPADQVETVRARAVAGNILKTRVRAGTPIHSHDGYALAFGTFDAADVRVTCAKKSAAKTCVLEVSVSRHPPGKSASPLEPAEDEFEFRAPVASPATKEAILRAISELKRDETKDETPGGSLAVFGESRPPRTRASVKLSVWGTLSDDAFASMQPAIDACYRLGGQQEMYLLSVNETGRVDRCEGRPWSPVPSRDCVCAALKKVQLPAAAAGKRAGFDIVHEDADGETHP